MASSLAFCASAPFHRASRSHFLAPSPLTRIQSRPLPCHPRPVSASPRMNQIQDHAPAEPDTSMAPPEQNSAPEQKGGPEQKVDPEQENVSPSESDKKKPQYSLRTRLREETEAPFRKARMFVYAGSAASASVGAFIAFLRIIAAAVGVSGVQPLNETVPNVAIDLAVIAVFAALLRFEMKAGERRLERMSRGARIASLRIEDAATRQILSLKDLRGRTRVVLVAGPAEKVTEAMNMAEEVKDGISKSNLLVVPFITDDEDVAPLRNWRMQPYAKDEWRRWFVAERDVVKSRMSSEANEVVVIVVRLDGKVGARSVGAPLWTRLVDEIAKLPKKDQYGKP